MLATLVGAPGRVFGREELLDLGVGPRRLRRARTVDVHVARLRGKFTAAKLPAPGIETVRGVGYRFREDPALVRNTIRNATVMCNANTCTAV